MPSKRANNEGYIRQRPDGRWEAQYTAGTRPDGKPIKRSIYASTQAEAAKRLREERERLENGTYAEPSRLTLSSWLDTWFNEYALPSKRESTATSYQDIIKNHIKPYLGARKLQTLRPEHVQTAMNELNRKGYAPATIRKARAVLHAALKQAVINRLLVVNPCDGTTIPKLEQEEINPLTVEEQVALLAVLPNTTSGRALHFIVGTGLRAEECSGLRWKDVKKDEFTVMQTIRRDRDFDGGPTKTKLTVNAPKTKAGRRPIPISPKMRALLDAQRRAQAECCLKTGTPFPELLFATATGGPTEGRNLTRTLHEALDKAQIPRRGVHALRHTFATRAIENGMDVRTLSEILGHASVAITLQLYVHSSTERKRSELEKLDGNL